MNCYMCRYSRGARSKSMKEIILGNGIEACVHYLVSTVLYPAMSRHFASQVQEVENMLHGGVVPTCSGRTGRKGLTTLGITSNYYAQPHLDVQDMGFAFLFWFVKGTYVIRFRVWLVKITRQLVWFVRLRAVRVMFDAHQPDPVCDDELFFRPARPRRNWACEERRAVHAPGVWHLLLPQRWHHDGPFHEHGPPLLTCS